MIRQTKFRDKVDGYIDDVMSDRLVTGRLEKWAVERHLRDLETGDSRGIYFDEDNAEWSCSWFRHIRHTQGEWAGQPFELYPFQAFIVWNIFGWKKKSDNLRRFAEAWLSKARGNGKTPLGVGILTQATAFDVLPGGTILRRAMGIIAATKMEQAKIGFSDLTAYCEYVDEDGVASELGEMCDVYRDYVRFLESDSVIKPLPADKKADGLRIQGALRDEIHAMTDHYRDFLAQIDKGMGKFPQPLKVTTTTAGNEHSRIWKEERRLCEMVLDPDSDFEMDTLFAMVCEIDPDDDPLDESVWPKANPLLRDGVVKLEHLQKEAKKGKVNANDLRAFERFHTNREVTSAGKPITSKQWALGNGELPDRGDAPCFAAIDIGTRRDLAAVAYLWPVGSKEVEGESKLTYRLEVDAFIPKGGERSLTSEPWKSWISSGLLTVTDSEWTDMDVIFESIRQRSEENSITSVAFDPHNAAHLATKVVNDLGIETFGFQQTCKKYNEPVNEFLQAVSEGRIYHGGNSLLAWNATNLTLKADAAGHVMPDKQFSDDKIDMIVASIMAFSESMFADPPKKSVYEERGPLMFDLDTMSF